MNTNKTGNISIAKAVASLSDAGYEILVPLGEGLPYDLVIDDGNTLYKVQVKTGRRNGACIDFNAYSETYEKEAGGRTPKNYRGKADLFCVYFQETDSCYLIPVLNVGTTTVSLRLTKTKNGQTKNVNWASDYLLAP